jgi:DNA-binding NtrC family response regulator
MEGSPIAHLLIVDDEATQVTALCRILRLEGYATTGVLSASAALDALRAGTYDIIVTDLMMPDLDGIGLLRAAWAIDPDLVGIVMTARAAAETAVAALKVGALDYIVKPFSLSGIVPALLRAMTVRRLRRQNATLLQHVVERAAEFESANQTLQTVRQQLTALADSISRELISPLEASVTWCEFLIGEKAGPLNPRQRDCLVNIWKTARRAAQFTRSLTAAEPSGDRTTR